MSTLRADVRAACATLLRAYGASAGLTLAVYEGRPSSLAPPHAFVDRIGDRVTYPGMDLRQRTPFAEVVVVHGKFDSKDSADQADKFADGFLDWVTPRYHEAGANTLIAVTSIEDEPTWVPDWLPPERQGPYYATRLTLEGFAED